MLRSPVSPATRLLPLLVLLFAVRPARAHDHWLEADPARVEPGKPAKLTLWLGEHLDRPEPKTVVRRDRYRSAQLVTASGRTDLLPSLRETENPIAVLTPTAPGSALVAFESAPIEIELGAEAFNAYLAEEKLGHVTLIRRARGELGTPGRERYSRSLKTIVQVGATVDETPAKPVGHEVEIVPDRNPAAVRPGKGVTVGFRVLQKGAPLPRQAVTAAVRVGKKVTARVVTTDGAGHASFALDRPGTWILRSVFMQRSTQPGADWRSHWTSLTFVAAAESQKGPRRGR